ncbi:MAG: hypothetical protein KJN76_12335, partial [Eudoraea sp.]|nr:hypothetical protein [Eudoraea sp.]
MKITMLKRIVLFAVLCAFPLVGVSQVKALGNKKSEVSAQAFTEMLNGRGLPEISANAAKDQNYTFVFVGYIAGNAGAKKYFFRDESGKGVVRISDIGDLQLGPRDKVR